MFCPKCAEQNLEDAKFCRACGANVSLVPQAMTGSLPTAVNRDKQAGGVKYMVTSIGLAWIAVMALLFAPAQIAWVCFFFAAVGAAIMFGGAVGEFVAAGHGRRHAHGHDRNTTKLAPHEARAEQLPPARATADMMQPASVAEGTTRSLAAVPRDRER